jgi:hypothetical protein
MSNEDLPPTEAELRDAEFLGLDVPLVDDARAAAMLLRSIEHGNLSELRLRAVRASVIGRKPLARR